MQLYLLIFQHYIGYIQEQIFRDIALGPVPILDHATPRMESAFAGHRLIEILQPGIGVYDSTDLLRPIPSEITLSDACQRLPFCDNVIIAEFFANPVSWSVAPPAKEEKSLGILVPSDKSAVTPAKSAN